jgi:hypothetical protein
MLPPVRTVLVGAAALAAAVGLVACGSKKSAETTTAQADPAVAWASGVCSALTGWRATAQEAVSSVRGNPSQDGVNTALDEIQAGTKALSSSLQALGAPQTANSEQAKKTIDTLQSQLQDGAAAIRRAVNSSSGAMETVSSVTGALATMQTQLTAARDALRSLEGGELHDAFRSSPACRQLLSSGKGA